MKQSEVRQHDSLLKNNPDAAQDINKIRTTLIKIKQSVHTSPQINVNLTFDRQPRKNGVLFANSLMARSYIQDRSAFTQPFTEKRSSFYKPTIVTKVTHTKASKNRGGGDKSGVFSDNEAKQTKKAAMHTNPQIPSQLELPTRNFLASLRIAVMELDPIEDTSNQTDGDQQRQQKQQEPNSQKGRPPPITLTSAINLIQLQKQVKGLVKGSFQFLNTRNGTKIVTKEMADLSAIKEYLNSKNLNYFTFCPKSLKPIKTARQHANREDLRGTGGTRF